MLGIGQRFGAIAGGLFVLADRSRGTHIGNHVALGHPVYAARGYHTA